jgi:hypothetical protein
VLRLIPRDTSWLRASHFRFQYRRSFTYAYCCLGGNSGQAIGVGDIPTSADWGIGGKGWVMWGGDISEKRRID